MDRISRKITTSIVPPSNAAPAYARSNELGFSRMMNVSTGSVDGLNTGLRADMNPALTMALRSLIGNYGIGVPPKLRIFSAKKGFKLEDGDDRDGKFEQLLSDHPGVTDLLTQSATPSTSGTPSRSGTPSSTQSPSQTPTQSSSPSESGTASLTQTQSQAISSRNAALDSAVSEFMSGSSNAAGYDTKGFLVEFKENSQPRAYSVVYDGLGTQVEEMDSKGWRPIKGHSDFMDDLREAYNRYSMTQAAMGHFGKN